MIILKYKVIGQGEKKVFFLHELMGDSTNYQASTFYLDKEDFTYYFVDLRGYGLSKHILGNYNLQEALNDIINLATFLNISTYTLVAHSMSTMIAQNIALKDTRVNKLILISPISFYGVPSTQKAKKNLLSQIAQDSGKIEKIVENSSLRYTKEWKHYRIKLAYSCSLLEARVGYMNMYLNENFEQNLVSQLNITIPVKVITGKYDFKTFSRNEVKKYFESFKDIEIIECQEAGHYTMIECPVFFASKLQHWFNS